MRFYPDRQEILPKYVYKYSLNLKNKLRMQISIISKYKCVLTADGVVFEEVISKANTEVLITLGVVCDTQTARQAGCTQGTLRLCNHRNNKLVLFCFCFRKRNQRLHVVLQKFKLLQTEAKYR